METLLSFQTHDVDECFQPQHIKKPHRPSALLEVNLLTGKDGEKKEEGCKKNTQKKEECGFTMTKEEADKHLKQKTGAHGREGKGRDF